MLYVYAISESPLRPKITGLRGAPLRTIGAAGPFAIASEHEDLRLEAGEDDLWAHENVVEEAMKEDAVLPMRFGTSLPDEAAVIEALRTGEQQYRRVLERVCGAVELAVRAVLHLPHEETAGRPIQGAGPVATPAAGTAHHLRPPG